MKISIIIIIIWMEMFLRLVSFCLQEIKFLIRMGIEADVVNSFMFRSPSSDVSFLLI